jgi:hypothetical protein
MKPVSKNKPDLDRLGLRMIGSPSLSRGELLKNRKTGCDKLGLRVIKTYG